MGEYLYLAVSMLTAKSLLCLCWETCTEMQFDVNLGWHSLLCFTALPACRMQTFLWSLHQLQRDQGRKGDRLTAGLHICYCFILIVPSNSRLQATLCVWGSLPVQKLLFSMWTIFPFIHSSAFLNLHFFFFKSLQRNTTFLLFFSKLSFTCCWNGEHRKWSLLLLFTLHKDTAFSQLLAIWPAFLWGNPACFHCVILHLSKTCLCAVTGSCKMDFMLWIRCKCWGEV